MGDHTGLGRAGSYAVDVGGQVDEVRVGLRSPVDPDGERIHH